MQFYRGNSLQFYQSKSRMARSLLGRSEPPLWLFAIFRGIRRCSETVVVVFERGADSVVPLKRSVCLCACAVVLHYTFPWGVTVCGAHPPSGVWHLPVLFSIPFFAMRKKPFEGILFVFLAWELSCVAPRYERWKFLIYWVPLFKYDPDVGFIAELCTYRCILHVKSRFER